MLFHTLENPRSGVEIEQVVFDFDAEPDASLLQGAWNTVIGRFPVLRTRFRWHGLEEPVQEVCAQGLATVATERHCVADRRQAETALDAFLRTDRERGFDPSTAPLLRLTLLRFDFRAESHWTLVWTFHHALLDGRSIALVWSEVAREYSGGAAAFPAVSPRPYRDYVTWIGSRDHVAGRAFWREYLSGFGRPTELELTRPGNAPTASDGHRIVECILPQDVTQRLAAAVTEHGLTLNTLVQGIWAIVLARYSSTDDVVFGAARACRQCLPPDSPDMVGLFMSTVPVRARIDPTAPLLDLLRSLRQAWVAMRDHEGMPLGEIQECIEAPRGEHLFRTLCVVDRERLTRRLAETAFGSLGVEARLIEHPAIPLTFAVHTEEQLHLSIGYDPAQFEAGAIERLLGHVRTLLEATPRALSHPIGTLPMLTADELVEADRLAWGTRRPAIRAPDPVHRQIWAQALARPNATAVVEGGTRITYAELRQRTLAVAHAIRREDVRRGARVAIVLPRSLEFVVAFLATMEAGATPIPFEPNTPALRLEKMLWAANPSLALAVGSTTDNLAGHPAKILALDRLPSSNAEDSASQLFLTDEEGPQPHDPAYVIFTSGSTGEPQGVVCSQQGLLNQVAAVIESYGLSAGDRVAQFASPGFDVCLEEILPTLAAGGTVVTRPSGPAPSGESFTRWIREQEISVANLPAAYFSEWIAALHAAGATLPECLRLVIAGNERVPRPAFDGFRHLPKTRPVRCLNAYGPTECTITATIFDPDRDPYPETGEVPIGRPLPNLAGHVLDRHGQHVPLGVPGELCLEGPGLAIGYLGAPERTAERFVELQALPGRRLFRTGDRVRRRADGVLEFLGRTDEQVNIRGYRIEPAEVEAVLRRQDGVREAAVAVSEVHPGDPQLAAYVVPWPHQATDGESPVELWPSVGEYPVYDDLLYHAMTHDEIRTARYREAIGRAVGGKSVVEIGTGKDAILARFCVDAGAAHVYAIESSPSACRQAADLIARLGLQERITLVPGRSMDVTLPEPVDVCVSEIIGTIGGSEGAAVILNDARRFLKPSGIMIPERCSTLLAAVSLPMDEPSLLHCGPVPRHYFDQVLDAVGHPFDPRLCLKNLTPEALLSGPREFESLDFTRITDPAFQRAIRLTITRPGRLDGFLLWIRLRVGRDSRLDSLTDRTSWLPVFLPALDGPIDVSPGDVVDLCAESFLSDDGVHPDYQVSGAVRRSHGPPAEFSFLSSHHSPGSYRSTEFYRAWHSARLSTNGRRDTVLNPKQLREQLRHHLPEHMVPAAVVILDALPRTPGGKVDRAALPPVLTAASADRAMNRFDSPRTALESRLCGIWCRVLSIPRVSVHDEFFALGGNSLVAIRLLGEVEKALGHLLDPASVFRARTVAEMALLLESQDPGGRWTSLVPIKPHGRRPPFYCVHASDGGVLWYRHLAEYLDDDQPFYGLQAQGLDGRHPQHTRMEEMARHYIEEIRTLQPSGPYFLGGVSFGALVAVEMAQQLRSAGHAVGMVALLEGWGPGYPRYLPLPMRLACHLRRLVRLPASEWQAYIGLRVGAIRRIFRRVWLHQVARQREKSGADTPNPKPAMVGDIPTLLEYVPQPYPGALHLFRAEEQPVGARDDPFAGWSGLAAEGVLVFPVPGYHGDIMREPNVRVLGSVLDGELRRLQQPPPARREDP
jgi:amino acid adenylation domain-containing protein